jgi:threonyl-tRNA synthetase
MLTYADVEQAGGGLVFWHPKGGRIRNIIETFWKDIHVSQGYADVC